MTIHSPKPDSKSDATASRASAVARRASGIHVILNESAGTAKAVGSLLEDWSRNGLVTFHRPDTAEAAVAMSRRAADAGADVVVAAGGDGTVNCVVQGLLAAKRSCPLGVLPLGTGNDFCRNAGIPLDPAAALDLIQIRVAKPVDVIRVSTESECFHYINMATAGNTGLYADLVTDDMKKFWGPMVYLRGAVDVLSNLKTYRVQLQFDDESPDTYDVLNLFFANGCVTGGGMTIAPDAQLDNGYIDVVVVLDCSPVDIAALATQYALSDYRSNPNILFRRVQSVAVRSSPPLAISADGDILTDQPTRFSVLPGMLQVIVGA
ncbi:diacylglycerol/lipid kinase family protein [Fuerstiella marisgermanici]|uniref:Diacylglycerol kinase n=1 Tax=Fuerstiella marisgermanici TaxID=1891926 RepID=A0A1P8WMH8_9PLAN|nr:diacylglycerol kinase family protein [Fuerstiella marisgermanici]APZ95273.1 Diacylglycerol kinase [Fuerstiella marisgermanici]